MQQKQQRSGVVRCQRCLKYGHYTYQCKNQVAYRYRPSRTVMFKQKMKLALNNQKGPKTVIKNPDYKRRIVQDRPSSSDEDQVQRQTGIDKKAQKDLKKQEKSKNNDKNQVQGKQKIGDQQAQQYEQQQQKQQQKSQQSSSSDSSDSSSSDSSSDSSSQSESK